MLAPVMFFVLVVGGTIGAILSIRRKVQRNIERAFLEPDDKN